ncbi:PQQ-binding-like beta-propeller repeat protein [Ruania alkalisoli]|uniref:PQQ-binding-like beta-propeller repeat protein n=1 Tax=Ruania alkalisoli TaxID=2779775 RepID=A0A7M1SXH3_9MICO|nr:PQQ-binding-like beta-propeller repeat protein [Ruania alkalisoli]QOR71323.1 PQQ-binding-like beta-propeller repeat protein [Ruania alkalisoli]
MATPEHQPGPPQIPGPGSAFPQAPAVAPRRRGWVVLLAVAVPVLVGGLVIALVLPRLLGGPSASEPPLRAYPEQPTEAWTLTASELTASDEGWLQGVPASLGEDTMVVVAGSGEESASIAAISITGEVLWQVEEDRTIACVVGNDRIACVVGPAGEEILVLDGDGSERARFPSPVAVDAIYPLEDGVALLGDREEGSPVLRLRDDGTQVWEQRLTVQNPDWLPPTLVEDAGTLVVSYPIDQPWGLPAGDPWEFDLETGQLVAAGGTTCCRFDDGTVLEIGESASSWVSVDGEVTVLPGRATSALTWGTEPRLWGTAVALVPNWDTFTVLDQATLSVYQRGSTVPLATITDVWPEEASSEYGPVIPVVVSPEVIVLVIADANAAFALRAYTPEGTRLWSVTLDSGLRGLPMSDGARVVVDDDDGTIRAFSILDGSEQWRLPSEAQGMLVPLDRHLMLVSNGDADHSITLLNP